MKRSIGLIFALAAAIGAVVFIGSPVSASNKSAIALGCAISFTGDQSRATRVGAESFTETPTIWPCSGSTTSEV